MNREEQVKWVYARKLILQTAEDLSISALDNVIASLKHMRNVKKRPDQNQMDAALQKAKAFLVEKAMDNKTGTRDYYLTVYENTTTTYMYQIPLKDIIEALEKDTLFDMTYYDYYDCQDTGVEGRTVEVPVMANKDDQKRLEDILKHLDVYDFADRVG